MAGTTIDAVAATVEADTTVAAVTTDAAVDETAHDLAHGPVHDHAVTIADEDAPLDLEADQETDGTTDPSQRVDHARFATAEAVQDPGNPVPNPVLAHDRSSRYISH